MTRELKDKLKYLADKYETKDFLKADPSQFLYWYDLEGDGPVAVEVASFIAAMLAFGSRKQFIPKIQEIFTLADSFDRGQTLVKWLETSTPGFPSGSQKFYRFYSYDDMHVFFGELAGIIQKYGSLGQAVQKKMQEGTDPTEGTDLSENPAQTLSSLFPKSKIVPKGKNSANKRIHMFLRWMVRQNSPVDIGIWTWVKPASLVIPLDVHVMQEAIGLGLLPEKATASYKTSCALTAAMEEVFPGDPARADFALFGLGVDDKI